MSSLPQQRLTLQEYLAGERVSETRHEYFCGEVFQMAGGTRRHNSIALNIAAAAMREVRPRGCDVQAMDMRVRVPSGLYTYPDVVVFCGQPQFEDATEDTLLNPLVIIEVLSPSTEGYDRGKKFERYAELPSLRQYVLVAQGEPRVTSMLRQDVETMWTWSQAIGIDAELELTPLGVRLRLSEIYERVDFSSSEPPITDSSSQ